MSARNTKTVDQIALSVATPPLVDHTFAGTPRPQVPEDDTQPQITIGETDSTKKNAQIFAKFFSGQIGSKNAVDARERYLAGIHGLLALLSSMTATDASKIIVSMPVYPPRERRVANAWGSQACTPFKASSFDDITVLNDQMEDTGYPVASARIDVALIALALFVANDCKPLTGTIQVNPGLRDRYVAITSVNSKAFQVKRIFEGRALDTASTLSLASWQSFVTSDDSVVASASEAMRGRRIARTPTQGF